MWRDLDVKGFRYEGIQIWRDLDMKGFRYEGIRLWRNSDMKGFRYEGIYFWRDSDMKESFQRDPYWRATVKGVFSDNPKLNLPFCPLISGINNFKVCTTHFALIPSLLNLEFILESFFGNKKYESIKAWQERQSSFTVNLNGYQYAFDKCASFWGFCLVLRDQTTLIQHSRQTTFLD